MNHGSHWKKWLIEKAEFRLYSIDLNNPQLEQLLCSYLLPGLRHSAMSSSAGLVFYMEAPWMLFSKLLG